jgi:hypothetical protein
MRVYLAATADQLRALAERGRADGDWPGFAPVDSLRAELGEIGEEELEYALGVAAGEASAALGAETERPGRRLVVVAHVDDAAVRRDADVPGGVVVDGPISLSEVEAILASEGPSTVGAGDGDELGWYGAQEIADLLA